MQWLTKFRLGGKRLRKNESGATAIEFALVAGPFLGLLFAILEVALVYFAQFSLESAAEQAGRKTLRVGLAQSGQLNAAQFKGKVCSQLPDFMGCGEDLIIDVRSYDTFGEAVADLPDLFDESGNRNGNASKFCPGGENDVVIATIFYKWKLFMSLPGLGDFTGKTGLGLGNMPDGSRLIVASFALKNEPNIANPPALPGC